MTEQISEAEHLERIRRARSVPCPRCGAPVGKPCKSPNGSATGTHHAARYAAVYARRAKR